MDAQKQLDTRALELAARAEQRIVSHERECEHRQVEIIAKLDAQKTDRDSLRGEIKESLRGIYGILWKAAGALIALLILALAYFLVRFGLPGEAHAMADAPALHGEAQP
jgi:hypothetical protein